jgi:hypothetical protein
MFLKLIDTIDRFLFPQVSANRAGLFRILLGITLLLNHLLLFHHLTDWFGNQSIFPLDFILSKAHPYNFSLFFFNDTQSFVVTIYSVMLAATVAFTIGVYPRCAMAIMTICIVSFHIRTPFLFHAGDMLLRFVCILMIFLDTGKAYTLATRFQPTTTTTTVSGWVIRVIEIQLCIVYFFAAVSKMDSPMWMNGSHLFTMVNFPGRGFWNMEWLRTTPVLAEIANYLTLATECSFAWLYWRTALRPWVLTAAILMHLGIFLTINTVYFSEIMITLLVGVWMVGGVRPLAAPSPWSRGAESTDQ